MHKLRGKKLLIGVTAGIAAYKIPLLVRLLVKQGAEVKVILTHDALNFVTPLTLAVVSQGRIYTDSFNSQTGEWNSHIDLALWADAMVIAPATANTMAKMANGIADNLLLTTWLATRCPVFFAPAMDLDMLKHPTTQQNISTLTNMGNIVIEPGSGELASGLSGKGRMEEPDVIAEKLTAFFSRNNDFANKKVLITAGPTHEPIDSVRYISNYSSGKMGYALAASFADRGANVTLVSGPVEEKIEHPLVRVIPTKTAQEMYDACMPVSEESDIMVLAAAVADFTPESFASQKIKKRDKKSFTLNLKETKDILLELGAKKHINQYLVGFALETENEIENAKIKLKNKKADLIVLNSLKDEGAGFGTSTNKVTLLPANAEVVALPLLSKKKTAEQILNFIAEQIQKQK